MVKVSDWLHANKLTLNTKKSNYVIFHPYQKKMNYQVQLKLFDPNTNSVAYLEQQDYVKYLTTIPRARMSYGSIAHEAEGRMGYWLRGYEGERNNCSSKIHLVGQKNI